jgi:uncharacterized membrane protein (UPF0127 family)
MPARDGDVYTLLLSSTGKLFTVECVVSPPKLAQGLSGRKNLPAGTGMLFIFENLERHTMWMPDMNFPLDIVWLDETLSVVHITYGLQPCAETQPDDKGEGGDADDPRDEEGRCAVHQSLEWSPGRVRCIGQRLDPL